MAKFRFSLESVLRWRESRLRRAEEAFRKGLAELARLTQLRAEVTRMQLETLRNAAGRGTRPAWAISHSFDYAELLAARDLGLRRQLEQATRHLARLKNTYEEEKRGLKLMESLRHKHHARWSEAERRYWEVLAAEGYLATWRADSETPPD